MTMDPKERLHKLLQDDDIPDSTTAAADSTSNACNLYELLQVTEECKVPDIKKAYRKLALRFHPDKFHQTTGITQDDPTYTEKHAEWTQRFQRITLAYSILSDETKRRRYDRTGAVEDSVLDEVLEEGRDWEAYFDEIYQGMVNTQAIDQFAKTYRMSEEERQDVLEAYRESKGDIDAILNAVPLCTVEDEPRFRDILDQAIAGKEVPKYKAYKGFSAEKYAKRRVAAEKEAREAEVLAEELGLTDKLNKGGSRGNKRRRNETRETSEGEEDSTAGLQALIQKRNKHRMDDLIANLEAKYANGTDKSNGKKGKKGKRAKQHKESVPVDFVEPTDEEFEALQAKLFGKK
ncbi:hypothetical protein IWQ62_000901 [Dispira parvispora]|uniref:J domain-containing protein n=1 Tax=Dispira parvispora TaxID=1520584 RepID=A0A9W8E5J6_9FUNG|nr:hypothetical protein IWQ62_000901 [Dispira parvispora]